MSGLKMAKATQEDLDNMRLFYQVIEAFFRDNCENISDFDHFTEPEINRIKSAFDQSGDFNAESFLSLGYKYLLSGFFRIHFGYEVLISNTCDPDEDFLEFKDWIKQSIELLSEIDEYISPNPKNYVGFDSDLHKKIKSVLALHQKSIE